ncbi:MAG: HAD-IIIA family hydrolase [Desulfobacterales bacterium]|nr:HAD-IIIA family hydrolase [Desulfobacterales bacterium]
MTRAAIEKLASIKALLLDVDGVLTDGGVIYGDDGAETKVFNAKDGLGIRLLMDAGVSAAIVTGRRSGALRHRCRNLGIDLLFDGVSDKAALLGELQERLGVSPGEMAFMGDDLVDLPLMKKVGCAIAPADAREDVRDRVDIVVEAPGGRGAVREICESILKAKGLWEEILERFL